MKYGTAVGLQPCKICGIGADVLLDGGGAAANLCSGDDVMYLAGAMSGCLEFPRGVLNINSAPAVRIDSNAH